MRLAISCAFENPRPRLQSPAAATTAMRTDEPVRPAFPLQILRARVIGREVLHELLEGWRLVISPTRWKQGAHGHRNRGERLRSHARTRDMVTTCANGISNKAYLFLKKRGEADAKTHFIFEKRGKKEDAELELEFRRIVSGANDLKASMNNFEIHFSDKKTNSTGMQIADLTARPIALKVLRPAQVNRAYEIISRKIFKGKRFMHPKRGILG